eukprot:TRINITY_DN79204_c0_g1_i1.p1 TRINITY_DN79204_c0_g1~~TRINITY_DN79204_c0_g1_i1.p1  ORF type:complete len:203 (-),score=21.74 TRINITY_DN79204_c0_g1_i1:122-709(-)
MPKSGSCQGENAIAGGCCLLCFLCGPAFIVAGIGLLPGGVVMTGECSAEPASGFECVADSSQIFHAVFKNATMWLEQDNSTTPCSSLTLSASWGKGVGPMGGPDIKPCQEDAQILQSSDRHRCAVYDDGNCYEDGARNANNFNSIILILIGSLWLVAVAGIFFYILCGDAVKEKYRNWSQTTIKEIDDPERIGTS